jgi:hypothetical protein
MSKPDKQMIFGLGLSKTGTTSLHHALGILGYRSIHYPPAARMLAQDWSVLEPFDAASDISVSLVFKQLDNAFPGSKFVLTVRDLDTWLMSMQRNFDPVPTKYDATPELEIYSRIYGGSHRFDEDRLARAYRDHEQCVRDHFCDRAEDLLILDICAGDGWVTLCGFLDVPIPDLAFPRENISAMSGKI